MKENPFSDELMELAQRNVIINRMLGLYWSGQYSYEECLEIAVRALAEDNDNLRKIATDAVQRSNQPIIVDLAGHKWPLR